MPELMEFPVPPFAAWFFPYAGKRGADDIPNLWALAKATVSNPPEKLDPKYSPCSNKSLGLPN